MKRGIKRFIRYVERFFISKKALKFFIKDWESVLQSNSLAAQVLSAMNFTKQLETVEVEVPRIGNYLVIAPHPDDEIIGPGGTLLKMLENKAKIDVLFLTSGKKGEEKIREAESRNIATKMNFHPLFLKNVANDIKEKRAIKKISNYLTHGNYDGVFVSFLLDDHPDHRLASKLLYSAFLKGKISPSLPIWAYQIYSTIIPNIVVDITAKKTQKSDLIKIYASQFKYRDWAHYALGLNAFNSRFLKHRHDESYAELFFQLPMADYAKICKIYFESYRT